MQDFNPVETDKNLLRETTDIEKKLAKVRAGFKLIIGCVMAAPLISFLFYYSTARNQMQSEYLDKVTNIAIIAASQLDPRLHASMISSGENGPEYSQLLPRLVNIHHRVPEIYSLTSLILRDEKLYTVLNTSNVITQSVTGNELEPSSFLQEFPLVEEDPEAIAAIIRNEPYTFTEPYSNEVGTFHSACAPIEPLPGAYPSMVCVDVFARTLQSANRQLLMRSLATTGLIAAFGVFILLIAFDYMRLSRSAIMLMRKQRDIFLEASHTDPLTGALNRRSFDLLFKEAKAWLDRNRQPFSLLALDIDHFKGINDTYGHDTGDLILKELVQNLGRTMRKLDHLARMGGEEFIVLCNDTNAEKAMLLAEKLRQTAHEIKVPNTRGGDVRISISIGVYTVQSGEELIDAMKKSDLALYEAKEKGRNQSVQYSPDLKGSNQ